MSIFGETLRQARAHKGVTVKEAEQATRINRLHLAALEEENFEALPPLIYQRGIVRNYATYLDLDPNKLLAMFEEARGSGGEPTGVVPSIPPVDMPRQWVPNFAVIAFLVVMSAIVFAWFYSAYFAPGDPAPTATAPVPSVTPVPTGEGNIEAWSMVPTRVDKKTPTPQPTPTTDASLASAEASPDVATPEAAATDTPEPTATTEAVEEDETTADTETAAEDTSDTTSEAEDQPAEEETAPTGDLITITITPSEDINLTVYQDGVLVWSDYVAAGTTIGPLEATSFNIYTSNGAATWITNLANGTPFVMTEDPGEYTFNLP